jgi:hypothetical protein
VCGDAGVAIRLGGFGSAFATRMLGLCSDSAWPE